MKKTKLVKMIIGLSLVVGPFEARAAVAATPLWESKLSYGDDLSDHVMSKLDTLGKDLLRTTPSDYKTFCPNYKSLTYTEKKQMWTHLISAMTRYESNFNPKTRYTESFRDSSGNRVVSRGLLQLSIESANGYECGIRQASELHDPYVNLSCGIRILNRWVSRDARMAGKFRSKWRGGARYWSVLRTTSGSYSKIVSLVKSNPICRQ